MSALLADVDIFARHSDAAVFSARVTIANRVLPRV